MTVAAPLVEHMRAHARWALPNEGCGLLAFDAPGHPCFFYSCTNTRASARSFTVDPTEHLRAIQHADRNGWWIGGSFHSHPHGPIAPSAMDIAGALDPRWIYFIGNTDRVAGYRIEGAHPRAVYRSD